jgi:hypothetical protein
MARANRGAEVMSGEEGKVGKEGKVYSLIARRKMKFRRMTFGISTVLGRYRAKHSPHSLFPHRRAVTFPTDGNQRARITVAPAMIDGRITQHEAFARQKELRYTRFTPQ